MMMMLYACVCAAREKNADVVLRQSSNDFLDPQYSVRLLFSGFQTQIVRNNATLQILPRNQDVVFYIHANQSLDRVSSATLHKHCHLLFGAGNEKVIIVVVWTNTDPTRLKSFKILADTEKSWPGRVVQFSMEAEKWIGTDVLHWKESNSACFPSIVNFLSAKFVSEKQLQRATAGLRIMCYYFDATAVDIETVDLPKALWALFDKFRFLKCVHPETPTGCGTVLCFHTPAPDSSKDELLLDETVKRLFDQKNEAVIIATVVFGIYKHPTTKNPPHWAEIAKKWQHRKLLFTYFEFRTSRTFKSRDPEFTGSQAWVKAKFEEMQHCISEVDMEQDLKTAVAVLNPVPTNDKMPEYGKK